MKFHKFCKNVEILATYRSVNINSASRGSRDFPSLSKIEVGRCEFRVCDCSKTQNERRNQHRWVNATHPSANGQQICKINLILDKNPGDSKSRLEKECMLHVGENQTLMNTNNPESMKKTAQTSSHSLSLSDQCAGVFKTFLRIYFRRYCLDFV